MHTTPCIRIEETDAGHVGRLRGEVAAARAECAAAAQSLAAVCRDPRSTPQVLAEAARGILDVAGWLAGAAHRLATDDRR